MEIPYSLEPHPITGVNNGKLGMRLFLTSEVMLFGALFSSYILLRVGADVWPDGSERLYVSLGSFNTLVLIGSSVTVVMAYSQHITLLRFVTPHLHWRHARIIIRDRTQLATPATAAVMDQFRDPV